MKNTAGYHAESITKTSLRRHQLTADGAPMVVVIKQVELSKKQTNDLEPRSDTDSRAKSLQ